MLISKFSRALHYQDGTMLKLNDPNVLLQVAKYANTVDNFQLRVLYQRLKLELRNQLTASLPKHADVGTLVVEDDLKLRVEKRMEARELTQVFHGDAVAPLEPGYPENLDTVLLD